MKKLFCALLLLVMIGSIAAAEVQTPSEYLTENGYTVVETNAGDGLDVNAYIFCGLVYTPQTGTHSFFWIEKDGTVYTAQNAGEAILNAVSPVLGHMSAIKTFVEMCKTFSFDLGVYMRDSNICFGLSVDSDALRNLANNLADGHVAKFIVGWDDYLKYLTMFG